MVISYGETWSILQTAWLKYSKVGQATVSSERLLQWNKALGKNVIISCSSYQPVGQRVIKCWEGCTSGIRKSEMGMAIKLWVILYIRESLLSILHWSSLRQCRNCIIEVCPYGHSHSEQFPHTCIWPFLGISLPVMDIGIYYKYD